MRADTVLLRAKLMAPRIPPRHVQRLRLRTELDPPRPLTLVCAPAGAGKTVAVCEWLAAVEAPVAWLSLDDGDNDATRFFVHLVAALQQVEPSCGRAFTRAAASLGAADVATLVEELANQLHEITRSFFLVLDDYHVIRTAAVHDMIGFLVEHMPATMHIVMTSRRDPPLPLPRWRMRQQLTELGEVQLRFTGDETREFLNDSMGLGLSAAQTTLLEQRTEGWVGGLQLAGLSLRHHDDKETFLRRFAGDDRYVMDYLTAEVLAAQTADVRRFMLRTAVLERMNASLCEAVAGVTNSSDLLERLERERTFVIALDTKREWYRYHHLFQSLLLHQLAASDERAGDCHLAASHWFEREGAIAEAAQHALHAGNIERVGELIGSHGFRLAMAGRSKQVLRWIQEIPETVLWQDRERLRAALWCEYIRTGVLRAEWRGHLLEPASSDPPGWRSELAMFEAHELARSPDTYAEAQARASALLADPHCSEFTRLSLGAIIGACAHALGDLATADAAYASTVAAGLTHASVSMFVFGAHGYARLICLRDGADVGRQQVANWLEQAAERGWDRLPVAASLYHALGLMAWECGDHHACEVALERGLTLGEHEPTAVRHVLVTTLARLRLRQGRAEECDELLATMEGEHYIRPLIPVSLDPGIERAWLELERGNLDRVKAFLEERGFGANGDALTLVLGQQDEGPLLVSRYLLASREYTRAIAVLTSVLDAATSGRRRATVMRCRVELAVARMLRGDRHQAVQQLDAALDMVLDRNAEAEEDDSLCGMRQTVLSAPPELDALIRRRLEELAEDPSRRALLERLLVARGGHSAHATREQPAEPLSPSELRVLQQLVAGLANKEIAQSLFISLNTLKTHIRRVYAKIGARNRAEAIRQAQRLGLLEH